VINAVSNLTHQSKLLLYEGTDDVSPTADYWAYGECASFASFANNPWESGTEPNENGFGSTSRPSSSDRMFRFKSQYNFVEK